MLRSSAVFAARLIAASRRFGDVCYQFHRRVNWTQRYDERYYELEAGHFRTDPDAYLAQQLFVAPEVVDVFVKKLQFKQVLKALMKVTAHWLFQIFGSVTSYSIHLNNFSTYRKCYVDDIEMVFDPAEVGVFRAVYPFPLNTGRQLRYLKFLQSKGYLYKLAGNPYIVKDLLQFLLKRDVRSLQRLESRAQILRARQIAAQGLKTVQLSDEFDIGSLDFARTLARYHVHVVNSAHGVGKYLPVHAYKEFHVITERQIQYYYAVRPCRYTLRTLNDRGSSSGTVTSQDFPPRIRFVFLSQVFEGVTKLVASNEAILLERLNREFCCTPEVSLLYRPHPNRQQLVVPQGFKLLPNLDEVNGHTGTVFASFYSTCQIDPAFKGRKVLVRGNLIYPEIVFDESQEIFNIDGLVTLLLSLCNQIGQHKRKADIKLDTFKLPVQESNQA